MAGLEQRWHFGRCDDKQLTHLFGEVQGERVETSEVYHDVPVKSARKPEYVTNALAVERIEKPLRAGSLQEVNPVGRAAHQVTPKRRIQAVQVQGRVRDRVLGVHVHQERSRCGTGIQIHQQHLLFGLSLQLERTMARECGRAYTALDADEPHNSSRLSLCRLGS